MKYYNDDFNLKVYNQFKGVALKEGSTIKELLNDVILTFLGQLSAFKIREILNEKPKGKTEIRSVPIMEDTHEMIKAFIEDSDITIKEFLEAVMILTVKQNEEHNKDSLMKRHPGMIIQVPHNIYGIEPDYYTINTVNLGFPDPFLEIPQKLEKRFVINEPFPEENLEGFWYYIIGNGVEGKGYWVPEIFIIMANNERDSLIESYENMKEKYNDLTEKDGFNTFLVVEYGSINNWEQIIKVEKIIHSKANFMLTYNKLELNREIDSSSLVVNVDDFLLKEIGNICANNKIEDLGVVKYHSI